jgi:hypothetical protein
LQIFVLRHDSKRLELLALARTAAQRTVDPRDKSPRIQLDVPLMQMGSAGDQQEVGRAMVTMEVVMDSNAAPAQHLVSRAPISM